MTTDTPTPTPAPALTDEQMDKRLRYYLHCLEKSHGVPEKETDTLIAAVVAKAKREERERIETRAKAIQCAATDAFGDGWNAALRALIETGEPAATSRKIGVKFIGGPWDGQNLDVYHVTAPVFAPGHRIGNHYWLDTKSDPPAYHWDGTEYETEGATR